MRSLVVATVLMAVVAQGFVDFHGMSGKPKRSVHPETGNIHYEHDVHHKFPNPMDPVQPTFFKAKYFAEHEAHWNIIELHDHVEGMHTVGCGMGVDNEIHHLAIQNPSASLLAKVHTQKESGYSHTVITAAAHHHCPGEKGIFRRLKGVETHEDGSIVLLCRDISYNHIFKNLDVTIQTNHVHQRSARSALELEGPDAPPSYARAQSMNRHYLARGMSTQGWFHHFTHAVSHAVSHVVSDASKVAAEAAAKVRAAAAAAKAEAERVAAAAKAKAEALAAAARKAAEEAKEKAEAIAAAAKKKAEELAAEAKKKAEEAAAEVKAEAKKAKEEAQKVAEEAAAKAKEVADKAAADAKKAGEAVGHAAKDVGHAVVKVAKKVYSAVTSFHIDHDFNLPGFNWNKDVTKSFSQWDMTVEETIRLAASFSFHPSVTFKLEVSEFHLHNFETYFEGVTKAGVTGSFSLDIQKVIGGSKVITDIKVHEITFSIGPVPVWIKPSVPIYAGFDIAFDADFTVSAVVSASSTIKFGYAHAPSTGTRHISEHDWTYKHDFGPMDYTIDIGVGAYVMPVLSVTIESVGEVQVGARIQADAVLQSNDDCLVAIDINANPTISLNAAVNLELLHHEIYQHMFGPYTLWTKKIPLYNWCKPQKASVKKFLAGDQGSWNSAGQLGRHMEEQSRVFTTTETALTTHHIGKSWSGNSGSMQQGHMISMDYGAQFDVNHKTNGSILYFTLALTQTSPGQPADFAGKLAATATMVYVNDVLPKVGMIMNYTLKSVINSTYAAATNSSVLAVSPSPWILWKVSQEDIRYVEMEGEMVYGTVSMISPSANNGTSSFNIFKNGGGRLEVAGMNLDKTDVYVIMIWGAVSTLLMIAAIVTAVVCFRKFTKARRTVDIVRTKENGSGLIVTGASTESSDNAEELSGEV